MKTVLTLTAAFALFIAPSCENLKQFADSPQGGAIISSGGALIVAEVVEGNPKAEAVLLALADTQDGTPIDFTQFEDAYVAIGVQTLGSLASYYGDDTTSALLSSAIRNGVALAKRNESSK